MLVLLTLGLMLVLPHPGWTMDIAEEDKQKHIAASFAISMMTYSFMRYSEYQKLTSSLTAMALTLTIGHIKEETDPFYDSKDMQANVIGASAGVIVPLFLDF